MRLLRQLAGISFGLTIATVAVLAAALAARLLLPTLPLAGPAVEASVPAPGASNVLPLNPVTVRFTQPMNRASVEQALRFDPPLPGVLIWRDAGRTLVFSPTEALAANTTYRLMLDDEARGWLFRSLSPYELAFRTAPAPTVTSLLPPDGATDVAPDAVLSVSFSRPIVPTELIGRALTLPELLIEPPIPHTTTWLDQSTLLVRPTERMLPGTTYTITLAPELRDLTRSALGQTVRWRIRTAGPKVVGFAPLDGQRDVGLRQPLIISLTTALDEAAVARALRITPPISGSLAVASATPEFGAAQVITFTPAAEWPASATIQVLLPGGVPPAQGQLGLQAPARWSFRTADQPRVIGRFPGEGQQLPAAQDVRLVFNTRFDQQTLVTALVFDPPVEQVSLQGEGGEFRVVAPLRSSTAYTITLPATLTDTNGVALGREYVLRFITAPPPPSLALPDVVGHFLTLSPGDEQVVQLEQVNISAGELTLYALDQATLVRTLDFSERDWREFQPERYGLRELNRAPLLPNEQPDIMQRTALPLSLNAEQPQIDPGTYYLRVVSADGPSLNLVAVVAPVALTLKYNPAEVLVWATDAASGAPLPDIPLTLYQNDAVLASGRSDADGLWRVARGGLSDAGAYRVVAGDVLGVVSSDWRLVGSATAQQARQQPARYQGLLWSDKRRYQPGDNIRLSAVLRQFGATSFSWPASNTRLSISVRPSGAAPIFNSELVLRPGIASTVFRLPPDAAAGRYFVQGTLNGTRLTTSFEVLLVEEAPLLVAVEAPEQFVAGTTQNIQVRVRSREGLDVAGAMVDWRLRCTPDTVASLSAGSCTTLEGSGASDATGLVTASLTLPAEAQGLHQLDVTAEEMAGIRGAATASLEIVPPLRLALSLPSLLVPADQAFDATVLVRGANEQPVANQVVTATLLRATTFDERGEAALEAVLRLQTVSDDNGSVAFSLPPLAPGRYTFSTAATGVVPVEQTFYSYRAGFTAWPVAAGDALLIADRAAYRPNDIATVLPLLPIEQATALVVREQPGALDPEVRLVRAGEPFTLTIPANASSLFVSLLAPLPQAPAFAGYVELPIKADSSLRVAIDGDQATYRPGASATLTITVADEIGQPLSADAALLLAEETTGLDANAVSQLLPTRQPPGVITAHSSVRAAGARQTQRSAPVEVTRRDPDDVERLQPARVQAPARFSQQLALRAEADGWAVFTATLPYTPTRVQAQVLVFADAARWEQTTTRLLVDEPVRAEPLLPSVLTTGDEVQLAVRLTNNTPLPQVVTVTLSAGAIVPQNGSAARQTVTIEPREALVVRWPGSVGAAPEALVRFDLQGADGLEQQLQARIPIRSSAPQRIEQGGGVAAPQFEVELPAATTADAALEVLVAPTTQAALLEHWQQLNAAEPRDALLDAETLRAGAALARAELLPAAALEAVIERLVAAQQPDGGWSWWPGGKSDRFVSVQVALGLAAVEEARVPPRTRSAAARFVQRALADTVEPNQQALLGYVLAQLGQPNSSQAQTLAVSPAQLNPAGLAALVLSLPSDDPAAQRAVAALRSRAQQQNEGTVWPPANNGFQPLNAAAVSAWAVQALAHSDPADAMLPTARAALLAYYIGASWNENASAVELIVALAAPVPQAAERYRYFLTFNGVEILAHNVTNALTSTRRVMLDANDIQAGGTLRMVVEGTGQPLLRYQRRSASLAPATGLLALERRYLDARTGQALDPLRLALGQLVEVQLTLVVPRPVQFVTMNDTLPGALSVVQAPIGLSVFEYVGVVDDTVRVSTTQLAPGIYHQRYLARATVQGAFAVPPPQVVLRYDRAATSAGITSRIQVGK